MSEGDKSKGEEELAKAVIALHESVANLLSVFIPILAVLFVSFQNANDTIEVLGAKFTRSQGAIISELLIIVACYFCARNLFVMSNLLDKIQDKSLLRVMLKSSTALLNPFTKINLPSKVAIFIKLSLAEGIFNYSGLVLMHIAPLGIVLGFADLIVSTQRSLILATLDFVLVLLFAVIYYAFYAGLVKVIVRVNRKDARLRRRILRISIWGLTVLFLVYSYIANLENYRNALQEMINGK
jgi:hypothetical protein